MKKISKEMKMDLLDLSKRITNSISFEDVEDISVGVDECMNGESNRIQIDITYKENTIEN